MGIAPDIRTHGISTIYKTTDAGNAVISNLPVLNTVVNVTHLNTHQSSLTNSGKQQLKWKARFYGNYHHAYANNKPSTVRQETDPQGKIISFVETVVKPGQQVKVSLK
jgi:hypothetical protein